jgi:hypothetical protein
MYYMYVLGISGGRPRPVNGLPAVFHPPSIPFRGDTFIRSIIGPAFPFRISE